MSEFLKTVFSLSLSGTLMFFIIVALKPLYKNKLCKRWQYYIWLIVIIRLLLPFTPETTLIGSAFKYLNGANVKTIQTSITDNIQSGFNQDHTYIEPNEGLKEQSPYIAPSHPVQNFFSKVYENLWILWAAIAFALWIRKITMYQSFVRFVKAGRTEVADIEMLNMLADIGEIVGAKRPVELYTNPLISSPMLLGFFRPCIILPGNELDRAELVYILRHELTHYRHMDMFYKWIVQITVCLHWFNPAVYLLAKEINKCCELSCDETIISTMDKEEKKAYGDTLLNSLKVMGYYNDNPAPVTLAEGAEQLRERLDAIMKFKKMTKSTAVIMLMFTLALVAGATAIGAYAAPMDQKQSGNEQLRSSTDSKADASINSSVILPDHTKELLVSFDIDNGGVQILQTASNEIKAGYDSEYYDVDITDSRGKWNISIIGKKAMMGATSNVQLYLPDVKCTMEVNVLNGNFSYALPNDCADEISITARNAGIDFSSKNQYKNSAISLTATDKDFLKYNPPTYPDYFTRTNTGFQYTNGTGKNKITISLTGYTGVNFLEQSYTYSQDGYYQGSYIFELGWNLSESGSDAYTKKVDLTLSDRSTMTAAFDKSCESEAQNQDVLSELVNLIERLNAQNINFTPIKEPLVVSVTYVDNSELTTLADDYYTNGELTRFSAIFSALNHDVQKKYSVKIIEDGKTAFLSSCAENMKSDLLDYCAEKTYQDDKIALFSCIVPYLPVDQKQTWIARASRDDKITFLSVLSGS